MDHCHPELLRRIRAIPDSADPSSTPNPKSSPAPNSNPKPRMRKRQRNRMQPPLRIPPPQPSASHNARANKSLPPLPANQVLRRLHQLNLHRAHNTFPQVQSARPNPPFNQCPNDFCSPGAPFPALESLARLGDLFGLSLFYPCDFLSILRLLIAADANPGILHFVLQAFSLLRAIDRPRQSDRLHKSQRAATQGLPDAMETKYRNIARPSLAR